MIERKQVMNKKDLTDLSIAEDVAEKVIILHGKDIESHKTKLSAMQTELDAAKGQLTEASTTIEGFKKLDVDAIKAAADDYKAKFEQAQADNTKQLAGLRFDHALESALATAKAKNPKAVQALLNRETLKFNDADGSIVGLSEQLETIKKDNDYLFSDGKEPPRIVAGGNNQNVLGNALMDAARRGAKLSEPK